MSLTGFWTISVTNDVGGSTETTAATFHTRTKAWRLTGISCAEIDTTQLSSTVKTFVLGTQDRGMIEFDCYVERTGTNTSAIVQRSVPTTPQGNWEGTCSTGTSVGGTNYQHTCEWAGVLQSVTFDASIDEAVTATYAVRLTSLTYTVTGTA